LLVVKVACARNDIRLRSAKPWALIASRTWSGKLLSFDEEILVGTPVRKRSTGILGGSYVADRVDPLIKETLGDHQAPADPTDGQVAIASQSVQSLRARDSAAMD
jgi:hypothetical protein